MGLCITLNQRELGWGPIRHCWSQLEFCHSLHWWTQQALPFKNQALRPFFSAKVQLKRMGEIREYSQHSDLYICNPYEKTKRSSHEDGGLDSHSTHSCGCLGPYSLHCKLAKIHSIPGDITLSMGSVKTALPLVSLLTLVCTPSLIYLLYLTNYLITLHSLGKGTYTSAFACDQVKMLFTISKPFWKISLKLSRRIFISTASLLSPDLHTGVQKMLTVLESLLKTGQWFYQHR